ncbi:MAG: succinate dehydrogenase, hydrophobic membrane anchor protein [Caulobacteraceae bacterium]
MASGLATPLRRARGLGSAKRGVGEFIGQRVSAVALLFLGPWALLAGAHLVGHDFGDVRAWLAAPVNATLMVLLVLAGFYHGQIGLRVIIEDYIEGRMAKTALLILNTLVAWAAAALAVVCILGVSFGAGTA